jgi:hypothetical protein
VIGSALSARNDVICHQERSCRPTVDAGAIPGGNECREVAPRRLLVRARAAGRTGTSSPFVTRAGHGSSLRGRGSPGDVVRMHRMRRVRPTQGERASAGPPNDPGSPDRGRGGRHRPEEAGPDPGQWTPEPTEPGRKPQEPATRAGCSGSVPRTPCPCGLSAVHAPVGQQTYLQPCWGERAPSRATSQRPSSLPQRMSRSPWNLATAIL